MKFNWGYKIVFIYVVFVSGILYLVVQSSRQQMDLVTDDYYAQEIRYQEKIDQSKRAAALSESIHYQLINDGIEIIFPKEFQGKTITGNALLYYPANEQKDVAAVVNTNQGKMLITIPDKRSGMHILKITWEADGVSYYFEESVFLP
jgi:hypothetical protein